MEWFVLKNGDVLGPYETNSVAQMFGAETDILIWGVPHQEWLSFPDWARKMNMGAVATQASRSHSSSASQPYQQHQQHTPSSHSSSSPVAQTPASYSHVVTQAAQPQTPQAEPAVDVASQGHSHPQSSSHSVASPQSADSQALNQYDVQARDSNIVTDTQDVGHSSSASQGFSVTEDTGKVELEANLEATAVYVQPERVTAESNDSNYEEDDGRTVVSSVDLPLEIPNEEDVDNVIPLRAEAESVQQGDEDASDLAADLESLLGEAHQQLSDTHEPHLQDDDVAADTSAFADEAILKAGASTESPVAKKNLDEDQGTVDIEKMFEHDSVDSHESFMGSNELTPEALEALFQDSQTETEEAQVGGGQIEEEIDLSFDGQTQVSESAIDMASLMESDVPSRSAEAEEEMNFDFDGQSEVSEDATRVESLMDLEGIAQGNTSTDEEVKSLEWEGASAIEEEATRIQMDDFGAPAKQDEDLFTSEDATRVQAAQLDEEDSEEEPTRVQGASMEELEEEATRVQASDDNDIYDLEEEATRVEAQETASIESTSEEATRVQGSHFDQEDDYEEPTRVQGSTSDEEDVFDLEEEATRVEATQDEEDFEEGATRVSASATDSEEVNIEDLENLGDLEATEDELFEAFSIEDDNKDLDSDRVSAKAHGGGDGDHDEHYTLDEEPLDSPYEVEALEEEATRVEASDSSLEEDMSEFEEEVTQDAPEEIVQQLQEQDQDGEESSEAMSLEDATAVEDLKVIAKKMQEEKMKQEDFVWYIAYEGESEGPLTLSQVLKSIDDYEVKDFIYLWREGFIDWKNLFDVPELSSGLGIGFRRHSRVQTTGTVSVEFEGGVQIGQLDNLSESGIGLTGIDGLHLGDVVKVKLEADEIDDVVMLVARVRFVSESGLLGLSYEKDKYPENVTKVVDFVKSKAAQEEAA